MEESKDTLSINYNLSSNTSATLHIERSKNKSTAYEILEYEFEENNVVTTESPDSYYLYENYDYENEVYSISETNGLSEQVFVKMKYLFLTLIYLDSCQR